MVVETARCARKVSGEGGGGGAAGARAEITLQPVEKDHGEADCTPAAHGGPRWSRYPPAACEGP